MVGEEYEGQKGYSSVGRNVNKKKGGTEAVKGHSVECIVCPMTSGNGPHTVLGSGW